MKITRPIAALTILTMLSPSTAFAQVSKAGVVTTLEGSVTARRVALPDPLPLKFKDDVFLQDTVATGDKAFARMLLGGKAVVTVRERSVLTITEVPGRSTIELETGKFALAVAREKMRPGEEIQIRTPNAIAGVRGSVVVAEVVRQGAQVGRAAPAVLTNFYVLRGTITAQPLDPATRQPVGVPLNIGTLQVYSGAGSAAPRVAPVPPEQVSQITSGLQPTGPKGGQEAGQEQVKGQAMQTAMSLATALTGGPTGSDTPQVALATAPLASGSAGTIATTSQTTTAPIIPPISTELESEQIQALIDQIIALINLLLDITGSFSVAAGTSLKTFTGTTVLTTTDPIFTLTNGTVTQSGAEEDLIFLGPGANLTMAGPLAKVVNSTLTTDGAFLGIEGASLTSNTTQPFISFDPVTLTAAAFAYVEDGTLKLAGPLFKDVGGTLTLKGFGDEDDGAGNLLEIINATVTGTGTGALIQLTNTTLTTSGDHLVAFEGGNVTLAGPLLSITGGSITAGGMFFVEDGGQFTSTTTAPLISVSDAKLTLDDDFFDMGFDGTSTTVTLAGPLAKLSGVTLSVAASGFPVFDFNRGTFKSTGTDPLIIFSSTDLSTSNNFLVGRNDVAISLAGSLLSSTDSVLHTTSSLRSFFALVDGASITTSGTNDPLFSFTGTSSGESKVTAARNDFSISRNVTSNPGNLTLSGPFLTATLTDFKAGDPTANTFTHLFIGDGAQVKSTSTSAFLTYTNSTVDSAGNILTLRRSTPSTPTRLTLAGPLLSATNSSFNHTSLGFGASFSTSSSACCSAFSISQGAELTSTTTSALIQLTNSTVTGADSQSGGSFVSIADTFGGAPSGELVAPSKISLVGPLLQATNSTITSLFDTISVAQSALTSTTTSPLITLSGSTLKWGAAVNPVTGSVPFANLLEVFTTSGAFAASGSLAGPLLKGTNSTMTGNGNLVSVRNLAKGATFTSTTTQPLIQLDAATLTTDSTFINTGFSVFSAQSCPGTITGCTGLGQNADGTFATMNLNGPLLSASNASAVNTSGSLVFVGAGGQITVTGSTDPLISLAGGTHAIDSVGSSGGSPGGLSAVFDLNGRSAATTTETADGVSLTLGTDKPLVHSGGLLEASGATISSKKAVEVDTALVEASAPLLHLKSSSTMTASADALDLVQKAKLTSVGPIIKLDASTLTINSGAAALVRGGSFLKVTGDLFALNNAAQLKILNGAALSVVDSVVNISGAFVNFGGSGGNLVSITNSLCPCTPIGGLNVHLNGTSSANVSITNPIKNSGLGSITNDPNIAVISVSGSNSKVTISGN